MWREWGRGEVHTGFLWRTLRERGPLGRPRHTREGNIKMDLQEVEWGKWIVLMWLRIGTGGGFL
jgi:hypothetical protein